MASRSLLPSSRNMPMSRWGEDTDPFLAMRREMNRLFDGALFRVWIAERFRPRPSADASGTKNRRQ
jgi:hypothetical protein